MNIKEGDELKNILSHKVYRVKRIDKISVILESVEGTRNVWIVKENLKLFYEKMENKGGLEGSNNFWPPDSMGRKNV